MDIFVHVQFSSAHDEQIFLSMLWALVGIVDTSDQSSQQWLATTTTSCSQSRGRENLSN